MKLCEYVLAAVTALSSTAMSSSSVAGYDSVAGDDYLKTHDKPLDDDQAALRGSRDQGGETATRRLAYGSDNSPFEDHRVLPSVLVVNDFEYVGIGSCVDDRGGSYDAGKIRNSNFVECASACPTSHLMGAEDRNNYCLCLYDNGAMNTGHPAFENFWQNRQGRGPVMQAANKGSASECYRYTGPPGPGPVPPPVPDVVVRKQVQNFDDLSRGKCLSVTGDKYQFVGFRYGIGSFFSTFQEAVYNCDTNGLVGAEDEYNAIESTFVANCLYNFGQLVTPYVYDFYGEFDRGVGPPVRGDGNPNMFCYRYAPYIPRGPGPALPTVHRKSISSDYEGVQQGACLSVSGDTYQYVGIRYGFGTTYDRFRDAVAVCPQNVNGFVGVEDVGDAAQCLYGMGNPLPSGPFVDYTGGVGARGIGLPAGGNIDNGKYCYRYIYGGI